MIRRLVNLGLLAGVLLLFVAAANDVDRQVTSVRRIALDRALVRAYLRAHGHPTGFGRPFVAVHQRHDVACSQHRVRRGAPVDYRLCLELDHSGPRSGRIVGGYLLPPRGHDRSSVRTRCFGIARARAKCPAQPIRATN